MTQVVWGQAPWLPSFLVSALQVVPKNLVWDQAVIRETDSPPRYPLRGAKATSQRTGPQATRVRGKLEIHPLCTPSPCPVRKGTASPVSRHSNPLKALLGMMLNPFGYQSKALEEQRGHREGLRPPTPSCPLAQLHRFSLGKTAGSHVFHQQAGLASRQAGLF